ncbi:hypothetical protein BD309DRAFT_49619, partial [Dichomitus squalens]
AVLHPSLRLNWLTSVYGDDCREGYRALFTHVYTTYEAASLNAQTPPPAPPTQADNSDFLSEVCTVQRIPHRDIGSDDATQRVFSAMEEIDRYLRGEGGSGTFHDPLKWWRVSAHTFCYLTAPLSVLNEESGETRRISGHRTYGARFPRHSSNQRCRRTAFLELPPPVYRCSCLFQGGDNH